MVAKNVILSSRLYQVSEIGTNNMNEMDMGGKQNIEAFVVFVHNTNATDNIRVAGIAFTSRTWFGGRLRWLSDLSRCCRLN